MEAYDINSLIEFLRFPSVSADTQFKPQIEACADWLLQRFKRSGLATGVPALYGEKGFSNLERVWVRPTAEINGLGSGYQGEGSKTIVPSRATAKLSFRLVPDQNPTELRETITEFLIQNCPEAVAIEVMFQNQGKPYLVEPESPSGKAAQRGLGKDLRRTGRSYP
jgi:acetylornithine deacetylase/succinyl-diaminopimelate desuccinylase-like protein